MPLPSGGYTKSEFSEELDQLPFSAGPQESYVYPETDGLAFLCLEGSVKLLYERTPGSHSTNLFSDPSHKMSMYF